MEAASVFVTNSILPHDRFNGKELLSRADNDSNRDIASNGRREGPIISILFLGSRMVQ